MVGSWERLYNIHPDLCQDIIDHPSRYIGQPESPALIHVSEPLVIDPHEI